MEIEAKYRAAFEDHRAGKLEAAEGGCAEILKLAPGHADSLHLLGLIAWQRGDREVAAKLVERAIDSDPARPAFHNNLGNILTGVGKLAEAVAAYARALALAPDQPGLTTNLGVAQLLLGRVQEAGESFQASLNRDASDVEALFNLGVVRHEQGRFEEATACFRRVQELSPEYPGIHTNLGILLHLQGEIGAAVECFANEVQGNAPSAKAYNNLGAARQDQGRLEDAMACYRAALELEPDYASARSNVLVAMQYRSGITLDGLATAHAEFEREHAAPLRAEWKQQAFDFDPERCLRIGFISPNFCQHPVGHFVIHAVENLDRERFQAVCYSDRPVYDELTQRFAAASSLWRETRTLTDAGLAEQVRADRIDILFDLAGHTAKNRLLVCARRAAPVQITWADYVGTTGLAAMDYLLADRYEVPSEAEAFYTERILRMPNGYVCYDSPAYAPAVSPLPAMTQGLVTFGSFNYRPKISLEIVAAWAKILQQVPMSRLVLKNRGMNDVTVSGPLMAEFAKRGIDPQRIELQGWSPHAALLAEYQRVDVALDTFPYNGGLTTCEALWMGVPVITCSGETFASRHGLSHLSNAGLTETITSNLDQYVQVAMSLASDLPRLKELRSGLRSRMAASTLCDGRRFAQDLMKILREAWRRRCHQK